MVKKALQNVIQEAITYTMVKKELQNFNRKHLKILELRKIFIVRGVKFKSRAAQKICGYENLVLKNAHFWRQKSSWRMHAAAEFWSK